MYIRIYVVMCISLSLGANVCCVDKDTKRHLNESLSFSHTPMHIAISIYAKAQRRSREKKVSLFVCISCGEKVNYKVIIIVAVLVCYCAELHIDVAQTMSTV